MAIETPIAFLVFNRPDLTQQVFDRIAQAKPKKLLVVADGSRFSEEEEKCAKTREIIKKVDWNCEVLTNFSESNLGCKKRVSSGLDWVFSEVEEAIILEDDCLPAPSFFSFCQSLLEQYRDDERIMHIGGNNFQPSKRNNYSYYFSKYNHIWGWASWRRAWKYYDVQMETWPDYRELNLIQSVCENAYEQNYWTDIFDNAFNNRIDTWDYQWTYACWAQNGLSIIPNSNLVTNLGFRSDATHTQGESPLANLAKKDIWKIKHPIFVVRNKEADDYTFNYVFGGERMRNSNTYFGKIRQKLSGVKSQVRAWM